MLTAAIYSQQTVMQKAVIQEMSSAKLQQKQLASAYQPLVNMFLSSRETTKVKKTSRQ